MTAKATAAKLWLLEPLQALSLDEKTFRTAIAAAVAYCDEQGADHLTDLVKRARMLIAHRTYLLANPRAVSVAAYR